jgi:hypothetical protein
MLLQSLAGLPAFLVYFCTAIFSVVVYLFVYMRITPHDEFKLIRDNDPAAAVALGLSLLGFTLPLASHRPFRQYRGLPDLEPDRADRSSRDLLCRQDPGPEPVGKNCGGRTGTGNLARAFVARRRRACRRLDGLLTATG